MHSERQWPADDDRREEPGYAPEQGWRPPRRSAWPGTDLHANPDTFPPPPESKED